MKLLLFDLDGTLILTGGAGTRALERTFEKLYSIREALIDGVKFHGRTDPAIIRDIFQKSFGRTYSPEESENICTEYLVFLKEEVKNSPGYTVMPGVRELLSHLSTRDDILLGLATGNIEEAAWIKLERSGIGVFFKFGGFGSDSEEREELIRAAISRGSKLLGNRVDDKKVFVIGDTPLDIVHGRAVGALTVAVATGYYSIKELEKYEPDYLFENFLDFEKVAKIF